MHPPRSKGDFLGRLLLLLVIAFGLTVVLQARALRADVAPPRCSEHAPGPALTRVLRSNGFEANGVQVCLKRSRSGRAN